MKHAYLYATYSDLPDQLGAIIVKDDLIISGGWNQRVRDTIVSPILHALISCQHDPQDTMLVCPMPPTEGEAILILLAGIAVVLYDERMKNLAPNLDTIEEGLKMLEDIEINVFNDQLDCFTLRFDGKDFKP